jgi:hypothetical protein
MLARSEQSDVDFLTQVAGQAAIAIENATALAEKKLYLQDEIRSEQNFGEIIGDDPAFRRVLNNARRWRPQMRPLWRTPSAITSPACWSKRPPGPEATTLQSKMKKLGISR